MVPQSANITCSTSCARIFSVTVLSCRNGTLDNLYLPALSNNATTLQLICYAPPRSSFRRDAKPVASCLFCDPFKTVFQSFCSEIKKDPMHEKLKFVIACIQLRYDQNQGFRLTVPHNPVGRQVPLSQKSRESPFYLMEDTTNPCTAGRSKESCGTD